MGDKIAIMNNGELVQFDTPENILFAPANDFVKEFVGADRSLKVLNLLRVDTVMRTKLKKVNVNAEIQDIKSYFSHPNTNRILVQGENDEILGYLTREEMEKASTAKGWNRDIKRFPASLSEHNTLKDAMSDMLQHNIAALPVLDKNRNMLGIVTFGDIRDYIGEAYEEVEQEENEQEEEVL